MFPWASGSMKREIFDKPFLRNFEILLYFVWCTLHDELKHNPSQNIWHEFRKLSKIGLSMEISIADLFEFSSVVARFLVFEGRLDTNLCLELI